MKINLRFELNENGGSLYVTRPEGGDRAKASGFTKSIHGWGAEIHLLHLIRKRLESAGIILARKRIQGDKQFVHMYGDNHMCYLRIPIKLKSSMPHIWIVDPDYAVRSSADAYNAGEEVRFEVQGDIFQKNDQPPKQPDWWKRLYDLCQRSDVPCELSKPLQSKIA